MINEIWSGKIYLYAPIEAFYIGPKFLQINKPSNCFLVRYDIDLWSWRFFHDFTKEDSKENIQFTNLMKEENPNPDMGARFFNDASNREQTNHTCGFTLIDKNVFDNKENSFIYRQHFDDWIGAFNGSLNIVSAQDVPVRWMNAFESNAPLTEKNESRYKGLFYEGQKDDSVIQKHSDTEDHSVSFTLYELGLIIVKYCDAFKEMTKQGGNPPVLENVDKNLIEAMGNFKEEAEEYFLKYAFSMSKFNFENLNVDERTNVEVAINSALFQASFTEPDISHLMKTMGYNRKTSKNISYGNMVLKLFLEKYNLDINWEIIDKELKSY